MFICQKVKGIDLFFTKIQDIQDELAAIGEALQTTELVHLALINVFEEWEIFVQGILVRDILSRWDRMWSDPKRRNESISSKELHQWQQHQVLERCEGGR